MTDALFIAEWAETVEAPISSLALPERVFGLTDDGFRSLSPAHVAAATNRLDDGRGQFVAVESIGGVLFVHRYVAEIAERWHCRLVSRSDAFRDLVRGDVDVVWDIAVLAVTADTSVLTNRLRVRGDADVARLLAGPDGADAAAGIGQAARLHLREETAALAAVLSGLRADLPGTSEAAPAMPGRLLAASTCRAIVDAPAAAADLTGWLFGLSDAAYRAASPAHLAAGTSFAPDGARLSINVEQPGGLIVQHYRQTVSEAARCVVVSPRSDVFLAGRRSSLHVRWELGLSPLDAARAELVNIVTVRTTAEFDLFLTAAGVSIDDARRARQPVVEAHNADETPRFAADIAATTKRRLAARDARLGWEAMP